MRSSLKYAIEKLGNIDKAVEIGQRVGNNAEIMLKETDIKELYLVDPYLPYIDDSKEQSLVINQELQNKFKKGMLHRLCHFGDRISILNTTSQKASTLFDDKTFDYIYIDGDHSYEQALNDIKVWFPKVKDNGIVAGHDFKESFPGVVKAVVEFANQNNLKILKNGTSDWWFKKKNLRVVSFIYPGTFKPYKKMAETLQQSAKDNGYDCTIYPATKEEVGACKLYEKLYIKCPGRPMFVKEVLDKVKDDLVWLDLDCVIQKSLGNVLTDCDVAVTLRRIEDRTTMFMEKFKFINSGVMFFKNNKASRKFCDLWLENIGQDDCDQDGLNNLLLKYSKLEKYGEIIPVEGINVKILSCEEYNFFYFPEDSSKARVLHYKGFSFRKEKVYEYSQAT